MSRVTYLEHSGFAVTLPDVILVFDYVRDPSHALHRILEHNPELPVVFFESHSHNSHFPTSVFEIAQNHKRTYVLSNDIPAMRVPSTLNVAGMSAGDIIDNLPGGISVKAYKSINKGVAFVVTTSTGEKIFHAGELNLTDSSDEVPSRQTQKDENGFETLVNRIASENPTVDIAMFPVDVRLGTDFARGARIFLKAVNVKDFFPMAFDGDYRQACDFAAYAPDATTCHCMHDPGQSVDLSKK